MLAAAAAEEVPAHPALSRVGFLKKKNCSWRRIVWLAALYGREERRERLGCGGN